MEKVTCGMDVRKVLCSIRSSGSQGVCKTRVLRVSLVVWLQIRPESCAGKSPGCSVMYMCAISADRDSVIVIHSTAGFGPSSCCSWWRLSFEVWISSLSTGVNTNAINYWKLQSEVDIVAVSRCCVAEFTTLSCFCLVVCPASFLMFRPPFVFLCCGSLTLPLDLPQLTSRLCWPSISRSSTCKMQEYAMLHL